MIIHDREKAKELARILNVVDSIVKTMESNLTNLFKETGVEGNPKAEEFKNRLLKLVETEKWELEDKFIDLLTEFYNEQEIDAVLVFYKNPLAQRFIHTRDAFAAECYKLGEQWGEKLEKLVLMQMKNKSENS